MVNFYIDIKEQKFINQSLCWLGIVQNNHKINTVQKYVGVLEEPYCYIKEGIVGNDIITPIIQNQKNVEIYKNGTLVFALKTSKEELSKYYNNIFDLYVADEWVHLNQLISNLEDNKDKIYFINTEPKNIINNIIDQISGLASGTYLAELAYHNKSKKIIFFDYSVNSLDYQKDLIYSSNRLDIIKKYFNKGLLINGQCNTTIEDINKCNIKYINLIYDYLKDQDVSFLEIDLRNSNDIKRLFSSFKDGSIWISNALYYPTSINYDISKSFNLIDKLASERNIKILDHTRMVYEG